eukprot:86204-Heterocapsa_arctica.AAC.1
MSKLRGPQGRQIPQVVRLWCPQRLPGGPCMDQNQGPKRAQPSGCDYWGDHAAKGAHVAERPSPDGG